MTIGQKLLLGFGAALVLTLIVGGAAYWNLSSLSDSIDQLVTVHAHNQFDAGRASMFLSDLIGAERGIIAAAYAKDRNAVEQCNRDFGDVLAAWKTTSADLALKAQTAEARKMLEEMQASIGVLAGMHADLYAQVNAGNLDAANGMLKEEIMPVWAPLNDTADRLVEQEGGLMAAANESTRRQVATGIWVTLGTVILSVVVGIIIVLVVRQITNAVWETAVELAAGAEHVASAASQVSASSQSLAQGSSEQAASLEETSASSEEVNSMAGKNRDNSRVAAGLMTEFQQKFVQTSQALDQSIVAMGEINTQSDKISKIIRVIDEIAFQTNILALNAAVEAARAGEAGTGFAVVADEVRNLAQRSAQAAQDTSTLIEESIAKSNDGKVKVDQVASAIRSTTEDAFRVKTLVDEVDHGSQEQASRIEQIGRAIVQMERVTQNTAASAEESASASEELTAQSEALKAIVQRLTAMVGAGKATTAQTGPVQRGNGGSRRAGPDPLTAARTAPANP